MRGRLPAAVRSSWTCCLILAEGLESNASGRAVTPETKFGASKEPQHPLADPPTHTPTRTHTHSNTAADGETILAAMVPAAVLVLETGRVKRKVEKFSQRAASVSPRCIILAHVFEEEKKNVTHTHVNKGADCV